MDEGNIAEQCTSGITTHLTVLGCILTTKFVSTRVDLFSEYSALEKLVSTIKLIIICMRLKLYSDSVKLITNFLVKLQEYCIVIEKKQKSQERLYLEIKVHGL